MPAELVVAAGHGRPAERMFPQPFLMPANQPEEAPLRLLFAKMVQQSVEGAPTRFALLDEVFHHAITTLLALFPSPLGPKCADVGIYFRFPNDLGQNYVHDVMSSRLEKGLRRGVQVSRLSHLRETEF